LFYGLFKILHTNSLYFKRRPKFSEINRPGDYNGSKLK
jgi:hypothetical protein